MHLIMSILIERDGVGVKNSCPSCGIPYTKYTTSKELEQVQWCVGIFKSWTHANDHLSSTTCFTWYSVTTGSRKGPRRLSEWRQLGISLEDPDEDAYVRKFKFKRLDVVHPYCAPLTMKSEPLVMYVMPIYPIPRRLGIRIGSYFHW